MKYFFIILLFFSVKASAQFKAINVNNVILRYDTTLINEVPEAVNTYQWILLRLKTTGDTLAAIFYDGTIWTKADITSSNITAIGTSTMTMITVPTTVSASNRYLLSGNIVYSYTVSDHALPDLFSDQKLKKIIRLSDSKIIGNFFGSGVVWSVMPANPTLISNGIIKVVLP